MLDRRGFCLGGMAAAAAAAGRGLAAEQKASAAAAGRFGELSMSLALTGGKTLTFEQTAASKLGDYVGEFVHQQCQAQRQDEWTVFFRPDADGNRAEIVVERGNNLQQGDDLLDPYSATIKSGSAVVATIAVPFHYWMSRWRWQSAPRPIVRTPADLLRKRLIIPFSAALLYGLPRWQGLDNTTIVPTYRGPMDFTEINFGGGPGERDDIGLVTEPCAQYLLNQSEASLATILAQAEGVGSFPLHWRDPDSNAPIDWKTSPRAAKIQGSGLLPVSFPRCLDKGGKGSPPPEPAVSAVPGGSLKERKYWVQATYLYRDGESVGSPQASITVPPNHLLAVSSPPPAAEAALGWHVYVGTSPNKVEARRQTGFANNMIPLNFGTNWLQRSAPALAGGLFDGWDLSTTHHPMPSYIPYLLTDDPYYLEETQAIGNFVIQYFGWNRGTIGVGIVGLSEARDLAWGLRSILMSLLATPDNAPGWLLPKQYWRDRLRENREFLRRYQESDALVFKVFHACPIAQSIEAWQHGYLLFVLGLMKYNGGFAEWDDFYEWVLGSILPMMTEGSGWCRQVPTLYGYRILKQPIDSGLTVANAGRGEYDAMTFASWAEAYDNWLRTEASKRLRPEQIAELQACTGSKIYPLQSGGDYYIIAQGAVNLAVLNGIKAAAPAKKWMDTAMPVLMGPGGYGSTGVAAKWSVG